MFHSFPPTLLSFILYYLKYGVGLTYFPNAFIRYVDGLTVLSFQIQISEGVQSDSHTDGLYSFTDIHHKGMLHVKRLIYVVEKPVKLQLLQCTKNIIFACFSLNTHHFENPHIWMRYNCVYVSVSVQIASYDEKSHNQIRDSCKMNILLDQILPKLHVNQLQCVGAVISYNISFEFVEKVWWLNVEA